MMSRIILVTGGCRSGKSQYALDLASGIGESRVFIATAGAIDDEMRLRIDRHRQRRSAEGWDTIEEMVDLEDVINGTGGYDVALVDCLTLWVNNLMHDASLQGFQLSEDDIAQRALGVLHACREREGSVIFVTNEVGMGIAPENDLARSFRDLAGRCNQVIAAGADTVTMMVSGIPFKLK